MQKRKRKKENFRLPLSHNLDIGRVSEGEKEIYLVGRNGMEYRSMYVRVDVGNTIQYSNI